MYSWQVKGLAEEHWKWVKGLLDTTQGITLETCHYLFVTSGVHMVKHYKETTEPKRDRNGKFAKR